MIDMLKRHEIQVLRRAGHTLTEVAQLSGASVRTVQRVVEETAVTAIDNAAERARRQVGRPSTAEAFREVLVQALTEAPALKPRWTGQNRPVVDGSKPATTEGWPRQADVTSGAPRRASRCGPWCASCGART